MVLGTKIWLILLLNDYLLLPYCINKKKNSLSKGKFYGYAKFLNLSKNKNSVEYLFISNFRSIIKGFTPKVITQMKTLMKTL